MPIAAVPEPPATAQGRATRERILQAATELIAERGVAGVRLDDVRARTRTSKSQLYHYFADKAELVAAVVAELAAREDRGPAPDSMPALYRWRLELLARQRATGGRRAAVGLAAVAAQLSADAERPREVLRAATVARLARLTAGLAAMRERGELRAGCEPEVLATGLLAAAEGGTSLSSLTGDPAPLRQALDFALAQVEGWLAERPEAGVSS